MKNCITTTEVKSRFSSSPERFDNTAGSQLVEILIEQGFTVTTEPIIDFRGREAGIRVTKINGFGVSIDGNSRSTMFIKPASLSFRERMGARIICGKVINLKNFVARINEIIEFQKSKEAKQDTAKLKAEQFARIKEEVAKHGFITAEENFVKYGSFSVCLASEKDSIHNYLTVKLRILQTEDGFKVTGFNMKNLIGDYASIKDFEIIEEHAKKSIILMDSMQVKRMLTQLSVIFRKI